MIEVNQQAKAGAYLKGVISSYSQIVEQANNGSEYFTVRYDAPSYSIGSDILSGIEEKCGNVKCCERGFGSSLNHDGGYSFTVRMEIV